MCAEITQQQHQNEGEYKHYETVFDCQLRDLDTTKYIPLLSLQILLVWFLHDLT